LPEKEKQKKSDGSVYVAVTISLPFSLLSQFDEEIKRKGYTRSEGIRVGMRHLLEVWTGRRF
jgi:metal-responsive CopG/Arc/MetJ family transcriptional regulator